MKHRRVANLWRPHSSRAVETDIELANNCNSNNATTQLTPHTRAARYVFGCPSISTPQQTASLQAWVAWIRDEITSHWAGIVLPALIQLAYTRDTADIDAALSVVLDISSSVLDGSKRSLSVSNLAEQVCEAHQVTWSNMVMDSQTILLHLVFLALGWVTMLFTPSYNPDSLEYFTIRLPAYSRVDTSSQSLTSSSRRPLLGFLKNFGEFVPLVRNQSTGAEDFKVGPLHVAQLNFYALNRFCGVSIVWTNDIGTHLDFDVDKLELYLFRWPSFCAMNLQATQQMSAYRRYGIDKSSSIPVWYKD